MGPRARDFRMALQHAGAANIGRGLRRRTGRGAVQIPFRTRRHLEHGLTGAYATSAVHLAKTDTAGDRVLLLSGPTDLKLRVTGPVNGDALQMTFGLNVPTGTTRMTADQTSVLEAAGAPALHMPVAAYGSGLGGTIGIVSAIERGDWAFALGAAVEQRTEYTPIAIALASGTSETQVTPGTALHLSLGADRPLGEGRMGLLIVADGFTKDQVSVGSAAAATASTSYTLGPQFTALARFDFGSTSWRESGATVAARYRSAYTDATGTKVRGLRRDISRRLDRRHARPRRIGRA